MGSAYLDKNGKQASGKPAKAVPRHGGLQKAAIVQTLASLIWIPQAAIVATAVGRIANGGGFNDVLWLAASIATLGIVRSCLEAASGRMAFWAARAELTARRERAIEALSRRSPIDSARPSSGEAASVIGEQAEMIVPYLSRFQPARFKASAVPLAILVCVVPISWVAALILLFAMPLIPVFMALIGWRAQAASEKQLSATGGLNGFLLDRLRGMATIRSLNAVDATATRLRADAESLKVRTMAVLKIAFLSSAVLELFAALGVALVAVYIGFSLLGEIRFGAWTSGLDLTTGLFVLLLAPAFFEPLRELSAVWHDRAAGEAAIKAIDALNADGLMLPKGTHQSEDQASAPAGAIRMQNVGFRYSKDTDAVIDAFDLNIRPGEHVALLGASGSGKSTLLALIAGQASCETGTVTIDGQPANPHLQSKIAWVGQKPHVFAGTIAGNVLLNRRSLARLDAASALDLAKLGSLARNHGQRPLGDGGTGLSGGEVLRLAIARAAVNRDASIVLADEPTAHLDAETASDITESLLVLAKGRTLVVATHDPRLAARMDRTIVLDPETVREAAE
ncbi:thiol reductant ABC exporter subunit CydD [Rhizobium mesoamericanum]|uniref:Putative ABC transporter involved in cytochrome bd biosynthesis, ATP-binding protein n=1 Tax=Rhizobium mesoamericanum STM3625 TaxID=1211777 RepID=K0PSB1_9HYPH|nr:thiol reductant ABC exporter subunit CydD [Rhizobium mesoamericanum]CCM76708.1 putative ABC transporter involved in cytochrome bd biosynthesis, ATP-binding protein [Rhizobium mesoamericanum STM3625]